MLPVFGNVYAGKRVLVTGHTGFKGAWLSEWLLALGADVTGYSDRIYRHPDLFTALKLESRLDHKIGDVRDLPALEAVVREARPDFVFHLAAQPLVRYSYSEPVETVATNVLGTAHLLDALRRVQHEVSCVIVTSDKCYDNREVLSGYREDDPLGGHDPYSASKGAAEIVVQSFRRSYFSDAKACVKVASARAGNVIGGGDWSEDRIVPDCIRSLAAGRPITVRNPAATRPWQHVLEPLSGYLWLGALLTGRIVLPRVTSRDCVAEAYNFGPWLEANRKVEDLVRELLRHWPGSWQTAGEKASVHEAGLLNLAIDKAYHQLCWQPVYDFGQSVAVTAQWYRHILGENARAHSETERDIADYVAAAHARGVAWACCVDAATTISETKAKLGSS